MDWNRQHGLRNNFRRILRCGRQCCRYRISIGQIDDKEEILPMKKVDIKCDILGALATLNIELHYTNSSNENPVEATYEFPLDKSALVSKLIATIDGKTIEAKVKEKEEAKERYDDAIAAGNAAVLAERQTDKNESMTIKLGNLQP